MKSPDDIKKGLEWDEVDKALQKVRLADAGEDDMWKPKTSADIKQGLQCCSEDGCVGCPYEQDCREADGFTEIAKDTLALIQQLQAENTEKDERIQQLEAERDAAVESMRKDPHCCFHCKHKGKWPSCNSDPRPNGSCFEWRGVQKEE